MSSVSFKKLTKTFPDGTNALRGIDLKVKPGEFLTLVGPSGCGKTTLLRILAGLEEASSGTVLIAERDASTLLPKNRDLGMVFQNYALFPHLTVFENLAFGLKARKIPGSEIQNAVEPVACRLGLSDLLKRKPNELSGGQRQRVALGRLLARNPSIHLFDEPLSNLDANLRASMRKELAQLHAENKKTTLYVTHDQVEAMTLGERICVMNDGKIIQVGTPSEVYDRPAHRFVAEFFGSPPVNLFQGRIESGRDGRKFFVFDDHSIELPVPFHSPGPVVLGLRPENIIIHLNGKEKTDTSWRPRVERVENLGESRLIHLSLGTMSVTLRHSGRNIENGICLSIEPEWEKAHWFDSETGRRL